MLNQKYIMVVNYDDSNNQIGIVDIKKLPKHVKKIHNINRVPLRNFTYINLKSKDNQTQLNKCSLTISQIQNIEATKMDTHFNDFSQILLVPVNDVLKYSILAYKWSLIHKSGRGLAFYPLINKKLTKQHIKRCLSIKNIKKVIKRDSQTLKYMQFATTHYVIILGSHPVYFNPKDEFTTAFDNNRIKLDLAVKNKLDKPFYQCPAGHMFPRILSMSEKFHCMKKYVPSKKVSQNFNYGFTWKEAVKWDEMYNSEMKSPTKHASCFLKMCLVPFLVERMAYDIIKISDTLDDLSGFSQDSTYRNRDMTKIILEQWDNIWNE